MLSYLKVPEVRPEAATDVSRRVFDIQLLSPPYMPSVTGSTSMRAPAVGGAASQSDSDTSRRGAVLSATYESSSVPRDLDVFAHMQTQTEPAIPFIPSATELMFSDSELLALPVPKFTGADAHTAVESPFTGPKPIKRTAPEYPEVARLARVQGIVTLEAAITNTGKIAAIRVVSGHPLLISAAVECVKQWQYQPAILHNQRTAVPLVIEVKFTLTAKG